MPTSRQLAIKSGKPSKPTTQLNQQRPAEQDNKNKIKLAPLGQASLELPHPQGHGVAAG